jgi:hypothetical protein
LKRWPAIAAVGLLGAAGVAVAHTVLAVGTATACGSATSRSRSATTRQCATTTYTIPTDMVTAGSTRKPTKAPSPSNAIVKGYYDQGSNQLSDWSRYRGYGFNLVLAGKNTRLLDRLKADGASAWFQPDVWTGCGYQRSISEALGRARRAVATGAVSGFYVADEPSASMCPSAPAQIAAWTAILHAHFPGIPTILATYDSTDLGDFAHSADEFALDVYPCQYGNGCDYSWITELAAAADRLGLKYVGVVQAFGGDGHYDLPTASQLRQIIHTWQGTNELGYLVYAFSAEGMPPSSWLQNHPDLLSVIAANSGRIHARRRRG